MIKTFSIPVFALLLVLLAGQNAFACKCADPPTIEQSFEQSAAVFYGKVTDLHESGKQKAARFEIERSWKGADKDETIVYTETTSCGIDFQIGESYYLFVDRDASSGNSYRVVPCRRHAGTQENFLRDKPTLKLESIRNRAGTLLVGAAAITGGLFILAALIIAVYLFTRKKSGNI